MPSLEQTKATVPVEHKEGAVSSAEMEELVRQVGETLRLKAKCKQKTHNIHRKWPHSSKHCTNCLKNNNNHGKDCVLADCNGRFRADKLKTDPQRLLQKLLEEGSLIREAVQRLKLKTTSNNRTEPENSSSQQNKMVVCQNDLGFDSSWDGSYTFHLTPLNCEAWIQILTILLSSTRGHVHIVIGNLTWQIQMTVTCFEKPRLGDSIHVDGWDMIWIASNLFISWICTVVVCTSSSIQWLYLFVISWLVFSIIKPGTYFCVIKPCDCCPPPGNHSWQQLHADFHSNTWHGRRPDIT